MLSVKKRMGGSVLRSMRATTRRRSGTQKFFTKVQTGEIELFALNGNILSQAAPAPAADIQGIPFAFSSSQRVAALNDGEFGNYLCRELVSKNIQLIPFGGMENGFKQITSVDR